MTERAPAKVNLFLHVVGRRADGYHLLDSLAVFAGAADVIDARPARGLSLEVRGPFAVALGDGTDNLVLRAARALADVAGRSADAALVLHKALPVASGIGGGSADAAATLRGLCRLWDIAPGSVDLPGLALGIGADVPVCLVGRPARMGGIGERLSAAPALPSCGLLLANPGVALATAEVFRRRDPAFSAPAELPDAWPDAAAMARDLARLRNDLQAPARAVAPEIAPLLERIALLPGCLLARMSGSGGTCFGLFASAEAAEAAAGSVGQVAWCWGGALSPAAAFDWGVAKR
ncbi:MAG TPA: 4-(cytidine 5'-diphospho)-2-C-methyl-D-erythritol kinase [Acidisphaera sp.]|nr:4-(cytidine 5'-diphospho)-2-C-methyl-D-erythritol kinase [Acidisphaera sp.]